MAIRAVALDAMGVIYEAGDDVGQLLLPFLAALGLPHDRSTVEPLYLACSRGQLSSAKLWRRLGVPAGQVDDGLDGRYLAGHSLNPGVADFCGAAAARGVRVAALTNDVAEWSQALRTRVGLDGSIDPWIVSGEVGHRKPSVAIYECLFDRLGVAPAEIVFVDDRPANLDAAADLGLQTVLFTPTGAAAGCLAHRAVRSFAELSAVLFGA